MESATFLSGQLLLAMPGIGDPRFHQSVIAICAHDGDGAMGIDIGTAIDGLRLHEVLRQLEIDPGEAPDVAVHCGGPVEVRRGFVLHSRDWSGADTIDVAGRWALSSTLDALRSIADGCGPTHWLVALGYTGWGPGQLDGEMTRHGWLNVDAPDEAILFDMPLDRRWSDGFERTGIDPRLLANASGHA
ncbi:YqgE/AlgH family protein [Sphingomonas sp. TX0543]|uniref:YqgE/AlgH family protein n=1 Tax=unclassified Sphingomonas TaxID=196159 RepID=UPI0010F6A1A6|nr:YqgE/AlgH family protein [Sphingomonas sp. 3P27F8]